MKGPCQEYSLTCGCLLPINLNGCGSEFSKSVQCPMAGVSSEKKMVLSGGHNLNNKEDILCVSRSQRDLSGSSLDF